jgi:ubiquinone/menaquinone biosynthesis C-methylase UbiE
VLPLTQSQFNDGETYERLMGRWSRMVGVQFLDWLKPAKGLHWLDAGCGNGAFTEEIFANCEPAAVTGIDPSPSQIYFARKRAGVSQAQFQVGDAQALPFADASFDAATMALVIAFIPDAAKAVSELVRVVKPGSLVATYMWDMPDGVPVRPMYKAIAAVGYPAPMPPNAAASKTEKLISLWEDSGLTAVQSKIFSIETSFASFDDLWDTLTLPSGPQGVFVAGLPEPARHELRQILKAQVPVRADGRIVYPSFANAVKGVKAG